MSGEETSERPTPAFERFGTHPRYACIDGRWVAGHYYTKALAEDGAPPVPAGRDGRP